MRSIGLDLGAKKIAFCEVKDGQVVARKTASCVESIRELGPGTPKACVAIEACREAWHVHDLLVEWGHEVLVVDTTRVQKLGIGHHGRKTDCIDSELLARAVESGHIPEAHVLSPERRELRMQLSVRRALVETRAQYITTVRGLVRASGERLPSCEPESFTKHVHDATLSDETRKLCQPLLQLLDALGPSLADSERELQALLEREPIAKVLMSAPGVGVTVAAMFISVVDDAKRFRKAHQLESYLGLVPSENSSGGKRRIGSISKHGNAYLRALLVQAAWNVLRLANENDPLKRWAKTLVERRGKCIAVVAVARRLAGVLWAMWRDGTFYDPSMLGQMSAEGILRTAQTAELRGNAMARSAKKMKVFARHHRKHPQAVAAM